MIAALIIVAALVIAAFASVPVRRALERRREEQALRVYFSPARESWSEEEMDDTIRLFSDRPDFADWADEMGEPS